MDSQQCSRMVQNLERAASIISALRAALPETPISCKFVSLGNVTPLQRQLPFVTKWPRPMCRRLQFTGGVLGIGSSNQTIGKPCLGQVGKQLKQTHFRLLVSSNGDFYTQQEFQDLWKRRVMMGSCWLGPPCIIPVFFGNQQAHQIQQILVTIRGCCSRKPRSFKMCRSYKLINQIWNQMTDRSCVACCSNPIREI